VGPGAGLDDVEKRKFLALLGLERRPFGRPTRSQSLYRLCYPGSRFRAVRCPNTGPSTIFTDKRIFMVLFCPAREISSTSFGIRYLLTILTFVTVE
jgi:hypothetical protein